jgi:hypothetical protein
MLREHNERIFLLWHQNLICGAAEIAAIHAVRSDSEITNSHSADKPDLCICGYC